ncbi:MAG: acyltransferase family protein, partial [Acidimicrobiales bacterium]|nr:acyltransferase family protein [Acidimicrobiales bacterium]
VIDTTESDQVLDDPRKSDVDAWGRSENMRKFVRMMTGPVYRNWFRVEWDGLEKIPKEGGALLVANHAGAIPPDAAVIMQGIEQELGRPVYGMADFWFRTIPVVGTLWNRAGGIAAHPENAYKLLHDDGQLGLVFPEGVKGPSKLYKDRYRLRRFGRGGFVEIAMRSGVPIIPIAVMGAEDAMPILARFPTVAKSLGVPYFPLTLNQVLLTPFLGPLLSSVAYLPAKFRLRVLDPVHFDVPPNQERYSKSQVMDESEAIRLQIQEALFDLLRHRRNRWLG